MKVVKDGITKHIENKEWGYYCSRGWKKSGCSEPQPSQEDLYVIDDYTIGRLSDIHNSTH